MFYRVLLLSLAAVSCGTRSQPTRPVKLAVLRFENLSSDASLDWVGRGLSDLLTKELNAIPNSAGQLSAAPGISAESQGALLAGATRLITGYYTRVGGKLEITAQEEDLANRTITREARAEGEVLAAADALGRIFSAQPSPPATQSEPALRNYATGQESPPREAMSYFEQAAHNDPKFGEAYIAWSRTALALGDRAGFDGALEAAKSQGQGIPEIDRARLALEAATVQRDQHGRAAALAAITKLSPPDPANLRALAETEMGLRRYPDSVRHYEAAVALAPADADLRNQLAYSKMYAGDYAGALAAIREYQRLKPEDPNTLDSEGDIDFSFGKFAEAEKAYLAAYAKDHNFTDGIDAWKAGRARWIAGDKAGAEKLLRIYLDARIKAGDPLAHFREARWIYFDGDHDNAIRIAAATGDAATNVDVRSLCYTQAAIWEVIAGRRADAQRHASLALRPERPETVVNASLASFLAQPAASAAEWRARAENNIKGNGAEGFRRLALAYAMILVRDFHAAEPLWKQLYESTGPNDPVAQRFYAWTLSETGHADEAARLTAQYPLPGQTLSASWDALLPIPRPSQPALQK